jgi:hypothetical protein
LLLKIVGETLLSKLGPSVLIADGELARLSDWASLFVLWRRLMLNLPFDWKNEKLFLNPSTRWQLAQKCGDSNLLLYNLRCVGTSVFASSF